MYKTKSPRIYSVNDLVPYGSFQGHKFIDVFKHFQNYIEWMIINTSDICFSNLNDFYANGNPKPIEEINSLLLTEAEKKRISEIFQMTPSKHVLLDGEWFQMITYEHLKIIESENILFVENLPCAEIKFSSEAIAINYKKAIPILFKMTFKRKNKWSLSNPEIAFNQITRALNNDCNFEINSCKVIFNESHESFSLQLFFLINKIGIITSKISQTGNIGNLICIDHNVEIKSILKLMRILSEFVKIEQYGFYVQYELFNEAVFKEVIIGYPYYDNTFFVNTSECFPVTKLLELSPDVEQDYYLSCFPNAYYGPRGNSYTYH